MTHRIQSVRIVDKTYSTMVTLAYTFSAFYYTPPQPPYARNHVAKFCSNFISKFADDTDADTVVGWISNNDVIEYRKEIESIVTWFQNNKLPINVSKIKELVINFRERCRVQ